MDTKNLKILILRPAGTTRGGINSYYTTLHKKFKMQVEYFSRGARYWPIRKSKIKEVSRLFGDYYKFYKRIASGEIGLVQTSTSLYKNTIIRDGIFLWLAHIKGIKTVVFFRGWDQTFEKKLDIKYLGLFKKIYFKSDCFIVLSNKFKYKIEQWGYKRPIYVETTVVDSKLFAGIELDLPEKRTKDYENYGLKKFLFLARIEREKGIYEAIDAYAKIKANLPVVSLSIAGNGIELDTVKKYIIDNSIQDVKFLGFITGKDKAEAFLNADIYLFPSYTEGMPNSVLEAMAFGLPIIGTPVGGLEDILEDYVTGFRIPVKDRDYFAKKLFELINNPKMAAKISQHNYTFAHSKFTPQKVTERMEKIFLNTLNKNE